MGIIRNFKGPSFAEASEDKSFISRWHSSKFSFFRESNEHQCDGVRWIVGDAMVDGRHFVSRISSLVTR